MQIVLAWKKNPKTPAIEQVVQNLRCLYAELFETPPTAHTITGSDFGLVYFELPAKGWKTQYREADDNHWVLSIDFPFNARKVCSDIGLQANLRNLLVPTARALENDPVGALSRLSPHFALFWGDQQGDTLNVQVDGLGFCQLFEYVNGDDWAVSNRISAFKALGFEVRPNPSDFAVKFALKGFVNELSGFYNIRQFRPGQRCVLQNGQLQTEEIDVLGDWVQDQGMSPEDSLELARLSVFEELRAVNELWETPVCAGLTGGRDTRALVSTLLAEPFDFRARVRGRSNSYDVKIAKQLAYLAGHPLRVEEDAVFPPDTPEILLRKARLAALWQSGNQLPDLIKMFLAGHEYLDGGFTNLMGQHGEIGRGMYEIFLKLNPPSLPDEENEALLFNLFSGKNLPYLRNIHRERAREEFSVAYRHRSQKYRLYGWRRLNFYVLSQHTRRYNSGGHYAQPGQVITPFLNVDFIRASYNHPVENLRFHPFHEYIVQRNFPRWTAVEYDEVLIARDARRRQEMFEKIKASVAYYTGQLAFGRRAWARPHGGEDFVAWRYWNLVGKGVIEDSLRQGGLWQEVFEPDKVRESWRSVPDELLLLRALEECYAAHGA